ncbi:MAG: hypothetical protein QM763_20880 [Agriterribacter sp.]
MSTHVLQHTYEALQQKLHPDVLQLLEEWKTLQDKYASDAFE